MIEASPADHEPRTWLVVFHVSTGRPWLDRLIPGRFKHVSAIGWAEAAQAWVFYDVAMGRTQIRVLADRAGENLAGRTIARNGVLRVAPNPEVRKYWRVGFWCCPAMKHLLGLRSGALLPDGLWRDLVATGAEVIQDVRRRADATGADPRGAACGECGQG